MCDQISEYAVVIVVCVYMIGAAPVESAPAANSTSAAGDAAADEAGGTAQDYFITIGPDGNFLNGCQTFYPTGWNQ